MISGKKTLIVNVKNKFENISNDNGAEFALQINRWLFKPLGIWPRAKNCSYAEKILANTLVITTSLLMAFLALPNIAFLIKEESIMTKIMQTGPLSFCFMAIIKYYSLFFGQKDLSNCLEQIVTDWRELKSMSDRNIMISNAKYGRLGVIICAFFMYSGGTFFTLIVPQLPGSVKIINNEIIRPFSYPGYYKIFDPQQSPTYEIIFIMQSLSGYILLSITCAACGLAVALVMHAYGQLEIIILWLRHFLDQTEDNDPSHSLSEIIQKHVRTLRFIRSIEKLLCEVCFVEVLGCTLNICLIGYYIMTQWGQSDAIGVMTYTILLTSTIFNILLFCYIGELLTNECKKVGEMSYMINWYLLSEKKALGLILVIATAQKPVTITAGKFIDLSLNSFSNIMQTSLAYLNLLRTFME